MADLIPPPEHPYICTCGGLTEDLDDGTQRCVMCKTVWARTEPEKVASAYPDLERDEG
jgi:hypothetical protein